MNALKIIDESNNKEEAIKDIIKKPRAESDSDSDSDEGRPNEENENLFHLRR
jgi:hypothetical protein